MSEVWNFPSGSFSFQFPITQCD